MSGVTVSVILVVLLAVAVGVWYLGRAKLQLCPHCAWIVRRVQHGWQRCPRCHKQYGRHSRLRHH